MIKARSLQTFTSNMEVIMDNSTGKKMANDTGDWGNNKEMNPAANSSITEDGLLEDENSLDNGDTWRLSLNAGKGVSPGSVAVESGWYKTRDPRRAAGAAEGGGGPAARANLL
jgi:hypothetical protein